MNDCSRNHPDAARLSHAWETAHKAVERGMAFEKENAKLKALALQLWLNAGGTRQTFKDELEKI